MPSRLVAVSFDAHDPADVAQFWAGLLGWAGRSSPRPAERCCPVTTPESAFASSRPPRRRQAPTACDGTRSVGLFWHEALGWPLVWDEDEETAIQSPHGGTKVAWGGPPVAPKRGRNRQRFDLATDDLHDEVTRLVRLGATRLGARDGGIELADPDGNEFRVSPA